MKSRLPLIAIAAVLIVAAGAGWYWWKYYYSALPAGFLSGNGRIEADDIDITPKYSGRVQTLLVDEGDLVKAGQIVARMDTRDTEATLQKSQAQMMIAEQALEEAKAALIQRQTEHKLAEQELERTQSLVGKGFATHELLDQRQQTLNAADAALIAANARIGEAEAAIAATQHDVAYYKIVVADGTLTAPRDARVQYKLVNTGEVVGAGTKIFTLLDLSNVYMTVFLPTEDVGKIKLGSEARIIVDALPNLVIPASVSFVSPKSQFTPKMVETKSERDKLMFRVKVRIDPELLARHIADIRTGLPGVAYVRIDPNSAWPAYLQPNIPK
ncbi:MAG: HlyD family efflux transporter periplasmic adaptor subunit [Hyphomicrobium sp.]|uniref:HlyD family secretion protein n=1 Tax=Hyphomicrobium sp. TaxID=82 RepID=UPI0039E26C33